MLVRVSKLKVVTNYWKFRSGGEIGEGLSVQVYVLTVHLKVRPYSYPEGLGPWTQPSDL